MMFLKIQIKSLEYIILIVLSTIYNTFEYVHTEFNWISAEFVEDINSKSQGRWTATRNFVNFTIEQLEDLAKLRGYHPHPKFKPYTKRHENIMKENIPETFDAREVWQQCTSIGTIRNQGYCGASWNFAAAEVMTDRICVASEGMIEFTFSVEELISCCETCGNGCTNGYIYPPFEYWNHHGIPSGGYKHKLELSYNSAINELSKLTKGDLIDIIVTKEVPYAINVSKATEEVIEKGNYKSSILRKGCKPFTAMDGNTPVCLDRCVPGYNKTLEKELRHGLAAYHVETDVVQIQTEIMRHGPVVGAIDLYRDFFAYQEGVYDHVSWVLVGHHAVKIIGWGVENGLPYWLIANSWGTDFGQEGFVKIQRGVNQCGIEYAVTAGTPDILE